MKSTGSGGRSVSECHARPPVRKKDLRLCRPVFVERFVLFVFLITCIFGKAVPGQTVVVRLINGRSGKPIAKGRVYIAFDDLHSGQPLNLTTNREGEIQFDASGATTLQVHPVGMVSCGEQRTGMPMRNYSILRILKTDLVTENHCGRSDAEPLRGRLLYYVRPATEWQLFKN